MSPELLQVPAATKRRGKKCSSNPPSPRETGEGQWIFLVAFGDKVHPNLTLARRVFSESAFGAASVSNLRESSLEFLAREGAAIALDEHTAAEAKVGGGARAAVTVAASPGTRSARSGSSAPAEAGSSGRRSSALTCFGFRMCRCRRFWSWRRSTRTPRPIACTVAS